MWFVVFLSHMMVFIEDLCNALTRSLSLFRFSFSFKEMYSCACVVWNVVSRIAHEHLLLLILCSRLQ